MSPYRTSASPGAPAAPPEDDDLPFLLWLTLVLGAIRVAIALAARETWGGEASLAGLLFVAAAIGLLRHPRPPAAR